MSKKDLADVVNRAVEKGFQRPDDSEAKVSPPGTMHEVVNSDEDRAAAKNKYMETLRRNEAAKAAEEADALKVGHTATPMDQVNHYERKEDGHPDGQ